jgi:hypothetical protein
MPPAILEHEKLKACQEALRRAEAEVYGSSGRGKE